jgi:dynein regulatory complex protein 1
MLELLCQEADFLIDHETREALEQMGRDEADTVRCDTILRALGADTEEDIAKLLTYFFDDSADDAEPGEDVLALVDLNLKVTPDDVVRVVRAYVDERAAARRGEDAATKAMGATESARDAAARATVARRERARKQDKQFWDQLASMVPPQTVRMWDALERALQEYCQLLQQRGEMIEQVSKLHSDNGELKRLLTQYLQDPSNQLLHVPPTQTLRITASAARA